MNNGFFKLAFERLMENLLSMKFWIIASCLILSFILVWNGKMSGAEFAGLNGGVISTVLAIREGIKVIKIRALQDKDNDQDIKDIKV